MQLLENDDFTTVPDYKLDKDATFWPVNENGVLISGTLPSEQALLPDSLDITVSVGADFGNNHVISVPLKDVLSEIGNSAAVGCLVGVTHCQNMIDESSYISFDPEFSKSFIEDVGKKYNIATQHSALLLLHQAQQFLDNEIDCPATHPQHALWKQMKEAKETSKEITEIQKKIEVLEKLKRVAGLATTLLDMNNSGKPERESEKIRMNIYTSIQSSINNSFNDLNNFYSSVNNDASTLKRESSQLLEQLQTLKKENYEQIAKDVSSELEILTSVDDAVRNLVTRIESEVKDSPKHVTDVKNNLLEPIKNYLISYENSVRKLTSDMQENASLSKKEHEKEKSGDSTRISKLRQEIVDIQTGAKERERKRKEEEERKKKEEKEKKEI